MKIADNMNDKFECLGQLHLKVKKRTFVIFNANGLQNFLISLTHELIHFCNNKVGLTKAGFLFKAAITIEKKNIELY